jgi:hypothetical protein
MGGKPGRGAVQAAEGRVRWRLELILPKSLRRKGFPRKGQAAGGVFRMKKKLKRSSELPIKMHKNKWIRAVWMGKHKDQR